MLTLLDDWRNDDIKTKQFYRSGQHVFTISPDYISLGYDVFPLAIKNRKLGLVICPYKEGLNSFNGNASWLANRTSCLDQHPTKWEFTEERWQQVSVTGLKIWPTVYVQNPSISMATCDLATLQQAAAPALELYVALGIRSISRSKNSDLHEVDKDYIATQYRLLNLEMPKSLEIKWQVAVAKKRLQTST